MSRIEVSARQTTTHTGVVIPAGQKAYIKAVSGQTWLTHAHGSGGRCGVGGNGISANRRDGYQAFMGDEGCMWGAADQGNGVQWVTYWFPRGGDNATLEVPGPGTLVLGPNDDDYTDNSYDISVEIVVR